MLIRTIVLLFIILLEIKILFSDNIIQLHVKIQWTDQNISLKYIKIIK